MHIKKEQNEDSHPSEDCSARHSGSNNYNPTACVLIQRSGPCATLYRDYFPLILWLHE
jgi:hypothetical protein